MKRFSSLLILLSLTLSIVAQGKAKYVFYFIGDGMGVNQVNAAETYLAALEGRIGISPMAFSSFPHVALVHTESATNGVTDSAAGGTALATGEKTKNGVISMTPDGQTSIASIASEAKEMGMAVGVATSVSIDHATPASFFAHEASRSNYHRIGHDLLEANFDFYAGSAFLQPTHKDCPNEVPLYQLYENAGYTITKGLDFNEKKMKKAKRLMMIQSDEANAFDNTALPYAIDRGENDLTLATIVSKGIDFLMKKNKDGFFFAIEGGKIDWACHANDAAAVIRETLDLDEAVKVALEFYKQHPDETLIVVTADHETGGMSLGTGAYELRLQLLQYQKMSAWKYTKHISQLHTTLGDGFTWEVVKKDLTENFGFWEHIAISERQEARLKKAYEALVAGKAEGSKSLYSQEDALATTAKEIINRYALVGWTSGGHSNGYVPAFAIGVGAEQFSGRIDNTQVAIRTRQAFTLTHNERNMRLK